MTLKEAIECLTNPNVHEMVLPPNQLTEWLQELELLREKRWDECRQILCDCCGKKTKTLFKFPHYELGGNNIMAFSHDEQKLCTECAQRLCDFINGFSKSCGKKED